MKNLSLRLKITVINTIVLIICTLVLTISTSFSASRTIDSLSSYTEHSMVAITTSTESIDSFNNNSEEHTKGKGALEAAALSEAAKFEKEKLTLTSIIAMLFVIGLGSILTYLATGKSLKPVKNLSDEIRNINEHSLSKKMKENGAKDEIRDLTKSFNNMLTRIDDAFENQKQFSANVAHELRTPLAVTQMKIDVFNKVKNHGTDDYEKLIKTIEKNNNRLGKVVEELLTICNKDKINLNEKVDYEKLIKTIINDLSAIAMEKNIKIYEEININSREFYGNEQLLYRATYNLIENAIKYNKESGYIKIKVNNNAEFLFIEIEDSGIGIKKEDYEKIFNPFYRVDKSRSRKIGGSGLGLSIVKNIVEQHKGTITVESNENGSIFYVKYPL